MTQQKKKTIADRLTPRQKHAIAKAKEGSDNWLYKVLLETHSARLKVQSISLCGAEQWKRQTLTHFNNLFDYLYGFLEKENTKRWLQDAMDELSQEFDNENASL